MADPAQSEFAGKAALITGAASGIGAATARWLDAHGIGELLLVDCDEAGLAGLTFACAARRVTGDVSDPWLWDRLEPSVERLDLAVINAGIVSAGRIAESDFHSWRRGLTVNLDGAFLALRLALRRIAAGGRGGSVVLTSSAAGMKAVPGTGAYGVSKAAVIQLARIAAAEHAGDGIRVNAIAPGRVDTPIWTRTPEFEQLLARHGSREAALAALAAAISPDGFTSAETIAGQIGFLLSDASANVLGTVLVSDGGYTL